LLLRFWASQSGDMHFAWWLVLLLLEEYLLGCLSGHAW